MILITFSYVITDLETSFGISLNLSICFESQGACEKVIQVFNEHKLHKPLCNWTTDFVIKGKLLDVEGLLSEAIGILYIIKRKISQHRL